MTGPGRHRRAAFGAALLYFALGLVAQRSLVRALPSAVYHQAVPGNDCLLHTWTLAWDQHALATDPLHLYDANIFHPQPDTLLYSDHLLGLALLLAPLRALTDNALLVHNLATLAAPALDALALYALALELTGAPAAAVIAGLLYGLAPLRFQIDRCQIQMLAAWWLPLVFLFARRAVATNSARAGVLAGAALAFQGLTGIYLTAFLLPFLLLAHAVWARRFPLARSRRGWSALLASEAAAALVLLPFALAYRGVQRDLGASRSIVLNALLAETPAGLADGLPPVLLGLALVGVLARGVPEAFRAERRLLLLITAGSAVLALGPAMTLPGGLGRVWGPYAALLAVPGYDALRAPGRFVHVALLGGAVLAAGGFAALTRRLPPRGVALALAAAIVAFAVQAGAPTFRIQNAPPHPARSDSAYAWLAAQSQDTHLVELPIDDFAQGASQYQYASTAHWRRTIIGSTGIVPPFYPWIVRKLRRFPELDVLARLRALGVTHAVLHLPPHLYAHYQRLAADPASALEVAYGEPPTLVVRLGDRLPDAQPALRGRPLERASWQVTASAAAALAPRALDADPATSWSSWGDLEASLRRGWYDPLPFPAEWQHFLAAQPVRFALDLGAPATLTAVVLRLGGSDPLAAPAIVFETSDDGAEWRPLPGEIDPVPDVRSLVTRAAEARFAFVPRTPVRARHVRFSCHGLEWRIGDIQVHAE